MTVPDLTPEEREARALAFCGRCGSVVGIVHTRPECDAMYAAKYDAAVARMVANAERQGAERVAAAVEPVLTDRRYVYGEGTQVECLKRNVRAALAQAASRG